MGRGVAIYENRGFRFLNPGFRNQRKIFVLFSARERSQKFKVMKYGNIGSEKCCGHGLTRSNGKPITPLATPSPNASLVISYAELSLCCIFPPLSRLSPLGRLCQWKDANPA